MSINVLTASINLNIWLWEIAALTNAQHVVVLVLINKCLPVALHQKEAQEKQYHHLPEHLPAVGVHLQIVQVAVADEKKNYYRNKGKQPCFMAG